MQLGSGMGNSREDVTSQVGSASELSQHRNQNGYADNNGIDNAEAMHPKTAQPVTESDASDTDMRGSQGSASPQHESQKRKLDTIQGSQQAQGEEEESSAASPSTKPSLPQHEQMEPLEPLDISYSSTPASRRLKDVLMARLDGFVLTGRIQVVSLMIRVGRRLIPGWQ